MPKLVCLNCKQDWEGLVPCPSCGSSNIMERTQGWYWKVHKGEYKRASVTREVRRFVGWGLLLKMVEECDNTLYRVDEVEFLRKRDKGLIATLFLTGGRVGEVVRLRKNNFDFEEGKEKGVIVVKDMPLLKHWEKTGEWVEELEPSEYEVLTSGTIRALFKWDERAQKYIRKRWEMTQKDDVRDDFPIWLDEPLTPYFLEWYDTAEDYLFPAGRWRKDGQPYMSENRAYQIVTDIGGRLGLTLYDHWFRAQRARQLRKERKYHTFKLMRYFEWTSYKMVTEIYAKMPWELLV